MRWVVFTGIVLCAAIAVVVLAVGRAIDVMNVFAHPSTGESVYRASAATHTEEVPPAAEGLLGNASAAPPPALAEDLDEALRAAKAAPQVAADPGGQVDEIARKLAPKLAREAREHAADPAVRNADVERELLETWKEQKQIVAGQRDTIDSVLKETSR